jgi:predicted nucleotidyltransferase
MSSMGDGICVHPCASEVPILASLASLPAPQVDPETKELTEFEMRLPWWISVCGMKRDEVIATLREHRSEPRSAGIIRLSLFGSTARNEARADSDIDLLAAFDDARKLSLLNVIAIQDLLGQPGDLIEEGTLRPRMRQSATHETVRAF